MAKNVGERLVVVRREAPPIEVPADYGNEYLSCTDVPWNVCESSPTDWLVPQP